MRYVVMQAVAELEKRGYDPEVVDLISLKPFDIMSKRWRCIRLPLIRLSGRQLCNVAMIRKEQRDFVAACELCEEIAGSCNPRRFPHQWALAHYELARMYARYMPEPGQARITRALDHCRQAITGWTRAGRAVDLANARDLMGTLYRHQLEGDRQENLRQARQYHQDALDTLESYRQTEALAWARMQHNIGTTLFRCTTCPPGRLTFWMKLSFTFRTP